MKILVVAPFSSPITQRLLKQLKNAGYEVLLASHNVNEGEGIVNLGNLDSFLGYFNFLKIKRVVKDFKPDLVHAHVVNHYGLMCIFQKKPLVVAMWGSDIMLSPNTGNIIKRLIFKALNWFVLKRAARLHTSASHVAFEADKQCSGVLKKTDVFYWGFPLEKPDDNEVENIKFRMEKEFGLTGDDFIVFPRGIGAVYNPEIVAFIIKILILQNVHTRHKIIVLKGFANELDEDRFKSVVDLSAIVYINRLLTSDELYFLYSKTNIHFSIPLSDSLGGGVIEPALFGSYPILSNLPSYREYVDENYGLILNNYDSESIKELCEKISKGYFGKKRENIPLTYTLDAVMRNLADTYEKAQVDF